MKGVLRLSIWIAMAAELSCSAVCDTVLDSPQARTIELSAKGPVALCDVPFPVRWLNKWERPWTFRVSFDYRTEGVSGNAVALMLRGIKDDGAPALLALWPDTFTGNRDDVYVLAASEDFRNVAVDVQLPNTIRPQYRFEWVRRFGRTGRVEVKNMRVELSHRPLHHINGGEYRIEPAREKHFLLKNIFFEDSGTVDVEFAFPERNPTCLVNVRDVKGRVRRTVTGRGGKAHVHFPTRGFWDVEAVARYPDGSTIVTTGSVAVAGTPIPHEVIRKSRYGMMTVLGGNPLWEKLGSRWDQKFLMVDTEHRTLDLPNDTADVIFNFNKELTPKFLKSEANRRKSGCFPPEDWDAYRKFCGEWLDRHPLALKRCIGLTGELDFQWRGTDAEYVKMCRIFTEEGRRRNPRFFVCGPTASRIKLPYLKRMRKEGLFDFLSAVAIHHYVDGTKPEGEYWEDITSMFDYFDAEGIKLPVYITETGWTVGAGRYFVPVSRENQARYLTRAMAMLSSVRIDGIVWFVDFTMLDEFGAIRKGHEAAFPKPMLQAFATVTRNLSDVAGRMTLRRLDAKTYLSSGRKADGRWVHLLWRSSGEGRMPMQVLVSAAEDYLGTPVDNDRLFASEDPLYIFSQEDYAGPVWTPPPDGETVKPAVALLPDMKISPYVAGGAKTAKGAKTVPAEMWSIPSNAPVMRVSYGREGFVVELDAEDPTHVQRFSRERLVEGDSLTLAFDVDKGDPWLANEVYMRYKGHRCVEYSIALKENGKTEVFRRNCWIPDIGGFTHVGSNVRASVRREKGKTRYWVWLPWATLGLDEQLKPGAFVGFAATLYASDGKEVFCNNLFGGIAPPLDPMKYGTVELGKGETR